MGNTNSGGIGHGADCSPLASLALPFPVERGLVHSVLHEDKGAVHLACSPHNITSPLENTLAREHHSGQYLTPLEVTRKSTVLDMMVMLMLVVLFEQQCSTHS